MTGPDSTARQAAEPLPRQPEHEPHDPTPRIYVASLADYNAGQLHGTWLDARRDLAGLQAEIDDLLASSRLPDAEEWAIHDHDGFGIWTPSEYEALDTVASVARGIERHGLAFAAFAHWVGGASATEDEFQARYLGEWTSVEAYAQDLINSTGLTITVEPLAWRHYVRFDLEQFARVREYELHISPSTDGQLWLFNNEP